MITAYIDIACNSEGEYGFDKIAKRISQFPGVTKIVVVSGKADFVVIYEAEKFEDISHFVTEVLAPMDKVLSTATHFVLKEYQAGEISTQK